MITRVFDEFNAFFIVLVRFPISEPSNVSTSCTCRWSNRCSFFLHWHDSANKFSNSFVMFFIISEVGYKINKIPKITSEIQFYLNEINKAIHCYIWRIRLWKIRYSCNNFQHCLMNGIAWSVKLKSIRQFARFT